MMNEESKITRIKYLIFTGLILMILGLPFLLIDSLIINVIAGVSCLAGFWMFSIPVIYGYIFWS